MRRAFILGAIALIASGVLAPAAVFSQPASDDWTTLRTAAREANTSRIRSLIRRGADINGRWLSYSVLHNYTKIDLYMHPRKLKKKHYAIPALLKSYGFDYKAEHNRNMLASNITKNENDMPFLRALLAAGAVVDGNAIAAANYYNRPALAQVLREHQEQSDDRSKP